MPATGASTHTRQVFDKQVPTCKEAGEHETNLSVFAEENPVQLFADGRDIVLDPTSFRRDCEARGN